MESFSGQTVLVSGGAGGIAAGICREFARRGAAIAICDSDVTGARRVAGDIASNGSAGGTARAFDLDALSIEDCRRVVADVEREMGPICVLVNAIGWTLASNFIDSGPADWRRLIDVNLFTLFNVTHSVLPGMVARKYGRIVNIASDAGRVGKNGIAVYAAGKGGLIAFSKSIGIEHGPDGITVNVVSPGPTESKGFRATLTSRGRPHEDQIAAIVGITPVGRIGQPEDVAAAVLYFASRASGFVTGEVLSVSGGRTMVS